MDVNAYYWKIERCPNPKKAWVCDSTGRRLTVLTSLGMCERMAEEHNFTIDTIGVKIARTA